MVKPAEQSLVAAGPAPVQSRSHFFKFPENDGKTDIYLKIRLSTAVPGQKFSGACAVPASAG